MIRLKKSQCDARAWFDSGFSVWVMFFSVGLIAGQGTVDVSSTTPTVVQNGGHAPTAIASPNCTNVRPLFESRGINSAEIPTEPKNGKCIYIRSGAFSILASSLFIFPLLFLLFAPDNACAQSLNVQQTNAPSLFDKLRIESASAFAVSTSSKLESINSIFSNVPLN